ncbi:MipA/OmpV family protein [Achromobacter sp. Marseille-Q0513]|uniref:MipA/OmpV family protein n=1 Tax=Achromobacter sp. Marseille-Q0513 TaxID=2829161 RepID=UPI001B8E18F5|nr:MipA/OmpV family protein [Achromobacter sp. Marseille-Q0513]MBR8652532.1 MipA/OmpV family protein [Achromobacter sp. Marseille-Q0513]
MGILTSRSLLAAALLLATAGVQANGAGSNYAGLGLIVAPVYKGSSEYRTLPVPMVNYQSGSFFVTPRAGLPAMGLKTQLGPNWEAGVFVGLGLNRDSGDADRLKGLGDIDYHATYGAFVEWRPGPYALGVAYRQAAHEGYGGVMELRASYLAWRNEKNALRVGVNAEWANGDAMQTWYGVTPGQAARSRAGLSPYSASSGFQSASLYAAWSHRLSERWNMVSVLGVSTVLGDARDSPLVERDSNVFGSVGMVYAF